MKLTKTLRQAFVRAAMDDVPQIDYTEVLQQMIDAEMHRRMPPEIKAIAANPALAEWLNQEWMYTPGSLPSVLAICPVDQRTILSDDTEFYACMLEVRNSSRSQDETRDALRERLAACAESVTTREALVKLLPEFEKYMPVDETAARTQNLPAIANIAQDFKAAGWPK